MAWTDQCKIAFKTNADALLWKKKGGKGIMKILKELSRESGIPQKTLYRWYKDMEDEKEKSLKNETNEEVADFVDETHKNSGDHGDPLPICINCSEREVYIDHKTNKPVPKGNLSYGLCNPCRIKLGRIRNRDEKAKSHIDAVCPKCGHIYHIDKGRIK